MKTNPPSAVKEFERRLRKARQKVWRTAQARLAAGTLSACERCG
jgi:hypothetical protein